ncbi:MAG: sodium pump decarboxylase gamma subunit [Clostridium sp. SCN 57-10]|nr:MAG: sodium pump decarboxylase gamma subunit [Clostridium sp. SCN 57-10]
MNADLLRALTIMWQGMLGVFIVIGLIALLVSTLSRLTKKKQ